MYVVVDEILKAAKDYGTRIELLATPARGSRFIRWRRGCGASARCQLTVGPTTRVTAVFEKLRAVVTKSSPRAKPLRATLDRVRARRVRGRYRIVLKLHVNQDVVVSARLTNRRGRRILRRSWRVAAGDRRLALRVRARRGRYRLAVTIRSPSGEVKRIGRTLRFR